MRKLQAAAVSAGLVFCAILAPRVAPAQQRDAWDFRDPGIGRQQLEQVLERYLAAAASPAYSAAMRARAGAVSDSIRARLHDGDMRTGLRLRLTVEGQTGQAKLSDTFAVSTGPALVLPVVGRVDLAGVLRSELEGRITQSVDSVYRGAVVRVVLLTRIVVTGGVARPGFYALPGDALIADAIGAAGGVAATAELDQVYVERGRDKLWVTDSLQVAMREGRTIGVLGLQDEDRIIVPVAQPANALQTVQVVSYLLQLGLSLFTLSRVL